MNYSFKFLYSAYTNDSNRNLHGILTGMERLHRMFAGAGGALGHPPADAPTLDSSEQVYISSLALLKMLKHGNIYIYMCVYMCSVKKLSVK